MKEINEIVYRVALYHYPGIFNYQKNQILKKVISEASSSLKKLFLTPNAEWKAKYNLTEVEVEILKNVHKTLPNFSFLVEELINKDIKIITIDSKDYPVILKKNLKMKSPSIIYCKGNTDLLNKEAIAIVGSRNASEISLKFTEFIAKNSVKENKVVVSGFARGVDRQALDSTLKYNGNSIIVLPQGINTFYQIRKYYKQITTGKLLVLSTFHPDATWAVKLAMARNIYIYNLSNIIYVAESDFKGGTWSGVIQGLKNGRKIYVRMPLPEEKNANLLLIKKGAIPFQYTTTNKTYKKINNSTNYELLKSIYNLLSQKSIPLSSKEIITTLSLNITSSYLTKLLKKDTKINTIKKGNTYLFCTNDKDLLLFPSLYKKEK